MTVVQWWLTIPVVFVAAAIHALPWLSRPERLFGATVTEEFREREGRALIRRYELQMLPWTIVAIAVSLLLHPAAHSWLGLGVMLILLVPATINVWQMFNRLPRVADTGRVRTAELTVGRGSGWLALVLLLPLAALAGAAWYLRAHLGATSVMGVYRPLAIGGASVLTIAGLALTVRWGARRRAWNPAAMVALSIATWMVAGEFTMIGLRPLHDFSPGQVFGFESAMLIVLAVVAAVSVRWVRRPGAAHGEVTPDACWHGGIIYYNPRDPALVVEKRIGVGWTFNLAHPLAWAIVAIIFAIALLTTTAQAGQAMSAQTDIAGTWQGKLNAGALTLRIVVRITRTANGLTGEMQSPDQSPVWLPADSVTVTGGTVSIAIGKVNGVYNGTLSADGKTLTGDWKQGAGTFPLTLGRVTSEAELVPRRPQNPIKPYPYREAEVSYENPAAPGVTLAGTLTIPPGKGPFPAALLIAGSGAHDRDEALMGHKPFLVLADYLTRKGIVVLRVDKRGVGKSSGTYATATTADFASDAEVGAGYLRSRLEVNAAAVGLIGHSEGALVAPIVAAQDTKVAFIVMMAGTGVPGDEVIEEQAKLIELASGVDSADVEKHAAANKALLDQEKAGAGGSPWLRYFLTFDPATALRKVKCPVLVLNGSKDLQVAPDQNLPPIRQALKEGGNQRVEIVEMPGLNHLFQTAKTGLPTEYGEIEETMAPAAMEKIAQWILAADYSRSARTASTVAARRAGQ